MNVPGPVASEESRSSRPVFVSYATADRKEALGVTKAIERRGPKCWISTRDVEPGGNYQEEIVRAIRHARAMVLVFSEAANNSDEIKKELSLASRYHVPVMALRIEDVEPSDAFAYELSTRQWIDAFEGWDHSIDALVSKLEQASGGAPASEPQAKAHGHARIGGLPHSWVMAFAIVLLLVIAASAAYLWNPFAKSEPLTVQIADFKALNGVPVETPAAFQDALRAAFGDDNAVQVKDKDATFTLGGSIRNLGDKTQFTVELTDNRSGELVWSAAHDPLPDSGALAPQQVAQRVIWVVRCGLADAMKYRGRLPARALALYMQHCQLARWGEGSPDRKIDVIKRVLAVASDFSKAWAFLAEDAAQASWLAPRDKKAFLVTTGQEAANRALQIDPRNGYAYLAKAELEPQKAWAAQEKFHEMSVSLDESDCGCEQEEYGRFLMNVGRPSDAVEHWLRGLDMLPHSPSGNIGLILTEYQKGDTVAADRAIARYNEFWNGAPGIKFILLLQAVQKKHWAEAVTLAKAAYKNPEDAGPIIEGFAALASGNSARIAAARNGLVRAPPDNSEFSFILLTELGAPDEALSRLRKYYVGSDPDISFLFDPAIAPLRSLPGWTDMLRDYGLIGYWRTSHRPPEFCKAADAPPLCKTL